MLKAGLKVRKLKIKIKVYFSNLLKFESEYL